MLFTPPQTRRVIISRPIFVKGKGLPKDGVCLLREGEEVTIQTDNGAKWYTWAVYKGKGIKVAVIPSTL